MDLLRKGNSYRDVNEDAAQLQKSYTTTTGTIAKLDKAGNKGTLNSNKLNIYCKSKVDNKNKQGVKLKYKGFCCG